ncbi:unnamed protein product [Mytilus edulis]|uniref:Uncharacterized protein n=1 Tax=Mytilus edulis TaxID=6550 RepID=A0A8S3T641_MYTED|nr:unnamed protein product [Mytilus edulis]
MRSIVFSVYNESPLFVASVNNNISSAGLLLENGCNPNVYTQVEGHYIPHCETNHIEKLTIGIQDDTYLWMCAALLENAELYENSCAKLVVDMNEFSCINLKGPLTKPHSSFNMTPLFMASSSGFVDLVKLLLKRKANPNLGNGFNETPLYSAAEKGYIEIVNMLFEFKADPNLCNNHNVSPLQAATVNGFSEIVSLLLINGANPNHDDGDNGPPLILATHRCFYAIVELLLKFNADQIFAMAKARLVCTWLPKLVKLKLLDYSRKSRGSNVVDFNLNTPLHIASKTLRLLMFITSKTWTDIVFLVGSRIYLK